jgi:hypothetical protein
MYNKSEDFDDDNNPDRNNQDSDDKEDNANEKYDVNELKELIVNWLSLDEKIKVINEEVKDLKLEKNQYETYILEFMTNTKKEVIKTKDSVIKKNVYQSKGALKEELIMNSLTEILKDSVQAYEITQKIINSRPITEKVSLKTEKTEKKKNKFNKNNDI